MIPRSARCNNPCNIRVGDDWQGLVPRDQMTPEQFSETAFCVFATADYGFRAAAICIRNPLMNGDTKTLADVITRWAPAADNNNTMAYIGDVSGRSGIRYNAIIDPANFSQMFALIKAMATHETGSFEPWFSDVELEHGLKMAGIVEGGMS